MFVLVSKIIGEFNDNCRMQWSNFEDTLSDQLTWNDYSTKESRLISSTLERQFKKTQWL